MVVAGSVWDHANERAVEESKKPGLLSINHVNYVNLPIDCFLI